jgi:hypothetical protein
MMLLKQNFKGTLFRLTKPVEWTQRHVDRSCEKRRKEECEMTVSRTEERRGLKRMDGHHSCIKKGTASRTAVRICRIATKGSRPGHDMD